jgi:hypothetical protein
LELASLLLICTQDDGPADRSIFRSSFSVLILCEGVPAPFSSVKDASFEETRAMTSFHKPESSHLRRSTVCLEATAGCGGGCVTLRQLAKTELGLDGVFSAHNTSSNILLLSCTVSKSSAVYLEWRLDNVKSDCRPQDLTESPHH